MSKKVEIKLIDSGIKELLHSDAIEGICRQKAEAIANNTKGEFEVTVTRGKNRSWATVSTTDKDTFFRQRATRELLNSVGGMMK